jgi:hypothetical protein
MGINALTVGKPEAAALGVEAALGLDPNLLHERLSRGTEAIVHEVKHARDEELSECLDYVLRCRAGSSPLLFPNSPHPRDSDANGVLKKRLNKHGEGTSS